VLKAGPAVLGPASNLFGRNVGWDLRRCLEAQVRVARPASALTESRRRVRSVRLQRYPSSRQPTRLPTTGITQDELLIVSRGRPADASRRTERG
jgi:hypothetical protein